MKNFQLFLLFTMLSFAAKAQMEDKFWVLFGGDFVKGSYTGISPQVPDDQYKLYNLATTRMEIMGPKGNAIVDFSFNTIWLFNLHDNERSSSLTENRFHTVQNFPLFRYCHFKLKGDPKSKRRRFGLGWQFDWRKMGLSTNSDNNGQSAFGWPGLSYGPLELKGRAAIGANLQLVKQTKHIYTRLSLYGDFSPGKIKGFSVYPEATVIASFKRIAIYGIVTYRKDYLSGNRQTLEQRFYNVPVTTKSTATELRLQVGIGFDLWEFGNRKN